MRSDSAWLETEPRCPTSRPPAAPRCGRCRGKASPSLALVAVEVRLTLGDNALGIAVDNALERLVVGRALGPKAALVGLGYGEHLDVVDAVAAAGARRGAGWQRKVLVFGHVRGDVGTQRHGEVPALPAEKQPHHHDAGAIVLKHELAVALDEVEEVLGGVDTIFIGYAPLIRSGARIATGPYRWAIFYALRHPVAHGG